MDACPKCGGTALLVTWPEHGGTAGNIVEVTCRTCGATFYPGAALARSEQPKAAPLCTDCGIGQPEIGRVRCAACLLRLRHQPCVDCGLSIDAGQNGGRMRCPPCQRRRKNHLQRESNRRRGAGVEAVRTQPGE